MSQITSHILDTAKGRPAKGVPLSLFRESDGSSELIAKDTTNADGRAVALLEKDAVLDPGIYRIRFELENYLNSTTDGDGDVFYPFADITFRVAAGGEHYHIPLLLSPFGFTTYRGS